VNSSGFGSTLFTEPVSSPDAGVQLWIARLDSLSPNDISEMAAVLDATEQARTKQLRFERDRRRYIASHGILRHVVGAALDIPAPNIVFEYGPHGKPRIAGECPLCFNLSHAGELAIFALGLNRALGVDIEAIENLARGSNELCSLARRILSSRELTIWNELATESQRRQSLLRAWTRKEAFGKGTGEGLFDRLQAIEVALDAGNPQSSMTIRSSDESKRGREWVIHDLAAPAGFIAALAVEAVKPKQFRLPS
jgi:4'-phosphopantetheinyl transferase